MTLSAKALCTLALVETELGLSAGANTDRIEQHVRNSLMLVTALSNKIGYDKGAAIAKAAHANSTTLLEEAISSGLLTEEEFREVVDPRKMIGPSD